MAGTDLKEKKEQEEVKQYVTFNLGAEIYGINVMNAQEVVGLESISHVPNTLAFMRGVIDLRGKIVPVIDMRIKFGMQEKSYDDQNVIIMIEIHNELVGLIVDSVSDVIRLSGGDIQNTAHFTSSIDRDYVRGISKIGENIIIILDVDKIFSKEEIDGITRR